MSETNEQTLKKAFAVKADDVIKKRVKTEIQKKLDIFREKIFDLRKANTSYKNIAELIKEVTTEHGDPLIVSVQALRTYCQDILGFPQIKRGNKKDESKS